jgi:hypothetical protein
MHIPAGVTKTGPIDVGGGFTKVCGHRRFAGFAGCRSTELAGMRKFFRDAPEDRLKDRGVQHVFGHRLAQHGVALDRVEPGLQGLDIQTRQVGHRLTKRAQSFGGEEVQAERGGVNCQAGAMQCVLQAAQRQRPSLLCFQSSFERDDAAGLVPETHLAALLVFDQVRGEYMVLRAPRPQ